jgi:chromosome segregation ATPase
MADNSLKDPVVVRAVGINASSLPRGINPAYELYIISQVVDFTNVAGKANEAGQGAYDAQVKNDEQDLELANHEGRITAAEAKIVDHEIRITEAESDIAGLEVRVTTAESDSDFITGEIVDIEAELADHETRISALEYKTTRKKSEVVYSGDLVNNSV